MPTINQLVRKGRQPLQKRNKTPALEACPQKRGVCTQVKTNIPEKARNSRFMRKGFIRLTNGFEVFGYIPGEGHVLYAGTQSVCADPWRPREGFARCSLSHHSRHAGYARCQRS